MLSKNKQKLIQSLNAKKYRKEHGLFVAEGPKITGELLESDYEIQTIIHTADWAGKNIKSKKNIEYIEVKDHELEKLSNQNAPQQVLAVVQLPETEILPENCNEKLSIMLDGVQDPGNLGTIVRTADWFGIKNIICSPDCADLFNPKTLQATMGAFCRVTVFYTELSDFLSKTDKNLSVYGLLLDGENIYKKELSEKGILLMGSEGRGISPEILPFVSEKLLIPNFPEDVVSSESLNVSIATAIVCAEFRRPRKH